MRARPLGDEVLLEFYQQGHAVKVTAIDPVTYAEATIVGPATASEETLRRNAIRKLIYVINKKSGRLPAQTGNV